VSYSSESKHESDLQWIRVRDGKTTTYPDTARITFIVRLFLYFKNIFLKNTILF
jgi:hypothetical protein